MCDHWYCGTCNVCGDTVLLREEDFPPAFDGYRVHDDWLLPEPGCEVVCRLSGEVMEFLSMEPYLDGDDPHSSFLRQVGEEEGRIGMPICRLLREYIVPHGSAADS